MQSIRRRCHLMLALLAGPAGLLLSTHAAHAVENIGR